MFCIKHYMSELNSYSQQTKFKLHEKKLKFKVDLLEHENKSLMRTIREMSKKQPKETMMEIDIKITNGMKILPYKEMVKQFNMQVLHEVAKKTNFNKSHMSRALGVNRGTVFKMIHECGLDGVFEKNITVLK